MTGRQDMGMLQGTATTGRCTSTAIAGRDMGTTMAERQDMDTTQGAPMAGRRRSTDMTERTDTPMAVRQDMDTTQATVTAKRDTSAAMTESMGMDELGFLALLQSVDAFFPVGAFTLSNGLEDYVLSERLRDEEALPTYLRGFLQSFPYGDLGLLSLAYRNAGNREELRTLDHLAAAMKAAKEVRTGSIRMGSRYLKAREAIGDVTEGLAWYRDEIRGKRAYGFHPIALGIYAAEIGYAEEELLAMYGYSVLSAIVNNAVKLVPLSQLSGQRILYEAFDGLKEAAQAALHVTSEQLGVSGAAYEIHCMRHEKLYSRLYMS